MIYYIEAIYKKDGKKYTWYRNMIGDIIENIPKLLELNGFYKKIKIEKR